MENKMQMQLTEALGYYSLETVQANIDQLSPECITISIAIIIILAINRHGQRLLLDYCESNSRSTAEVRFNKIETQTNKSKDPEEAREVLNTFKKTIQPEGGSDTETDYNKLLDAFIDKMLEELMKLDNLLADYGLEALSGIDYIPTVNEAVEILTSYFSNF